MAAPSRTASSLAALQVIVPKPTGDEECHQFLSNPSRRIREPRLPRAPCLRSISPRRLPYPATGALAPRFPHIRLAEICPAAFPDVPGYPLPPRTVAPLLPP